MHHRPARPGSTRYLAGQVFLCRDEGISDKVAVMAKAQVKAGRLSFHVCCGRGPSIHILKTPDIDIHRRHIEKGCQAPAGEPTHRR
jgi:hypothetical protein